jgi:hypothetical protein
MRRSRISQTFRRRVDYRPRLIRGERDQDKYIDAIANASKFMWFDRRALG